MAELPAYMSILHGNEGVSCSMCRYKLNSIIII